MHGHTGQRCEQLGIVIFHGRLNGGLQAGLQAGVPMLSSWWGGSTVVPSWTTVVVALLTYPLLADAPSVAFALASMPRKIQYTSGTQIRLVAVEDWESSERSRSSFVPVERGMGRIRNASGASAFS
jgi:hypothetical protein